MITKQESFRQEREKASKVKDFRSIFENHNFSVRAKNCMYGFIRIYFEGDFPDSIDDFCIKIPPYEALKLKQCGRKTMREFYNFFKLYKIEWIKYNDVPLQLHDKIYNAENTCYNIRRRAVDNAIQTFNILEAIYKKLCADEVNRHCMENIAAGEIISRIRGIK